MQRKEEKTKYFIKCQLKQTDTIQFPYSFFISLRWPLHSVWRGIKWTKRVLMKYSGDLVRKWYQKWNKTLFVAKINRKSWNNNKIRHSNQISARFFHFCFVTTFISLNSMYISQTTVNHSCKRRSRIQLDNDRYLTSDAFEK